MKSSDNSNNILEIHNERMFLLLEGVSTESIDGDGDADIDLGKFPKRNYTDSLAGIVQKYCNDLIFVNQSQPGCCHCS